MSGTTSHAEFREVVAPSLTDKLHVGQPWKLGGLDFRVDGKYATGLGHTILSCVIKPESLEWEFEAKTNVGRGKQFASLPPRVSGLPTWETISVANKSSVPTEAQPRRE